MAVIVSTLLCGCATSKNFDRWNVPELERPLTLPEGVTRYHLIYGQSTSSPLNPFVYPLYWEQGASDRLTLVYMPLPLEARLRLHESAERSLSLGGAFLGPIYSRNKNFDWRPTARVLYRERLASRFALEAEGLLLMEITRDGVGNPGSTAGARLSLLHQIGPALSAGAGIWIQRENGTTRARYIGALPTGNEGLASENPRWRSPLSFEVQGRLSSQLELRLLFDYFSLGYPDGYTGSSLFASLLYSW